MAIRSDYRARRAMIETAQRLYEAQLISGTDGNLALRLDEGSLLVTPSGVPKNRLAPSDLLVVDNFGRRLSGRGRPTSELLMHLCAFRLRADLQAAVHAHPPWVIAGSMRDDIRFDLVPEAVVALGGVVQIPYARPGTRQLPDALEASLGGNHAVVMTRHGALTLGADLDAAYLRMETLEANAKVALLAVGGGRVQGLPRAEIEILLAAGRTPVATDDSGYDPIRGRSAIRISDEEALIQTLGQIRSE